MRELLVAVAALAVDLFLMGAVQGGQLVVELGAELLLTGLDGLLALRLRVGAHGREQAEAVEARHHHVREQQVRAPGAGGGPHIADADGRGIPSLPLVRLDPIRVGGIAIVDRDDGREG
mgnify:CR=1 FL=1